jgi:hypothetical protein
VSDQSPRCLTCGRLVVSLSEGYCSARCQSLADAGYRSPTHPPAALQPPAAMLEARVFVSGVPSDRLPAECAMIAAPDAERSLLRVSADDWDTLERVLADLREASRSADVQVFTLQQFTPGGLLATTTGPPRER